MEPNSLAVDPPTPPPASFLPCRRLKGKIGVLNPTTGQTEFTEFADYIIVLRPSTSAITVREDDDLESIFTMFDSNASKKVAKMTSSDDSKIGERAYWIRRTLREGRFGRIRYATALRRRHETDGREWELTDVVVAIKKYSREKLLNLQVAESPVKGIAARQYMACKTALPGEAFETRVQRIVARMVQSHIVSPIDVWIDDEFIWQIMPYCGAELFEVLDLEKDRFTEADARHWMRHILGALDFLHNTAGICHRDIRPENLLLHEESKSLVLIDFGMCLLLPSEGQLIKPQGICGTLPYMAPEIASNSPFDGKAVDLWQAGVILFVMLMGTHPWEKPAYNDIRFRLISEGHLEQTLKNKEPHLSNEAYDLLQAMLRLKPEDRLTLEQVRNHPWMKYRE